MHIWLQTFLTRQFSPSTCCCDKFCFHFYDIFTKGGGPHQIVHTQICVCGVEFIGFFRVKICSCKIKIDSAHSYANMYCPFTIIIIQPACNSVMLNKKLLNSALLFHVYVVFLFYPQHTNSCHQFCATYCSVIRLLQIFF